MAGTRPQSLEDFKLACTKRIEQLDAEIKLVQQLNAKSDDEPTTIRLMVLKLEKKRISDLLKNPNPEELHKKYDDYLKDFYLESYNAEQLELRRGETILSKIVEDLKDEKTRLMNLYQIKQMEGKNAYQFKGWNIHSLGTARERAVASLIGITEAIRIIETERPMSKERAKKVLQDLQSKVHEASKNSVTGESSGKSNTSTNIDSICSTLNATAPWPVSQTLPKPVKLSGTANFFTSHQTTPTESWLPDNTKKKKTDTPATTEEESGIEMLDSKPESVETTLTRRGSGKR